MKKSPKFSLLGFLRVCSLLLLLTAVGFLLFRLFHYRSPSETGGDVSSVLSEETEAPSFELVFLDVGQGDSTLLLCDGEAMLIDAGDEDHGSDVVACLKEHGVTELKYLLATHPHADHIGGMKKVLKKIDSVDTFLMPNAYNDTDAYDDLMSALDKADLGITVPAVGDVYRVGSATCTVLSPCDHAYEDDLNDYSVVLMIEYAGRKILMAGDAGPEPQSEMMASFDLSCDVYKVAHHGSWYNNSSLWLDALSPTYAVIPCDGESSHHPSEETVASLTQRGVTVYRTDRNGTVTLTISKSGLLSLTTEKE